MIPYRNRPKSLKNIPIIYDYIKNQKYIEQFNFIIVEQEEGKSFNLGKLINTGYSIFKTMYAPFSYSHSYCFLPIDMLPINIDFRLYNSDANFFFNPDYSLEFPKAFLYTNNCFEKINGFSNEYWGWGKEDYDMVYRLKTFNLKINKIYTKVKDTSFDTNEHPVSDPADLDRNTKLLYSYPNLFSSGLNNLSYIIKDIGTTYGIKKYTVSI